MKRFIRNILSILIVMMALTFCTKPEQIQFWKLPPSLPGSGKEKIPEAPPVIYPVFNPNLTYDSVTDVDGNVYKTIRIGNQTWMAENLKTTRYNDGSNIYYVPDNATRVTIREGAYWWYNNDAARYKVLYGALYNWYTVKTGKLCPEGWRVPSDDDWKQLEMTLGMSKQEADSYGETFGIDSRGTDQGTQLKTTSGWLHWEGIVDVGTNTSGFTALPAGETGWEGNFYGGGICTTWWYSTQEGGGRAVCTCDPGVIRGVFPAFCGLSVRCLKNQ